MQTVKIKKRKLEQVKIKMHHNVHNPRITHDIIVSINNKHRLYKISFKKNTSQAILNY